MSRASEHFYRRRDAARVLTAAIYALACSGEISSRDDAAWNLPPSVTDDATPGGDLDLPPGAAVGAQSGLRRLTVPQYQSSLRDLLGDQLQIPGDFEQDTVLNGFAAVGAKRMALSPRATEMFEATALGVAEQVFAQPSWRQVVAGCDPVVDVNCAAEFIRSFGKRAWRRPVQEPELQRYLGIANLARETLGDPWAGLQYAMAGLLQSPHFLYRVELGTPDASDSTRYKFDSFEIATRLSYLLWNTTPDDALLAAAENAGLWTAANLETQTQRLMQSERVESALQHFFGEFLALSGLDELPQLPEVFPQVSDTLGESMRAETLQFMTAHALSDGDYRSIFDSRETFVNAELAELYEVPAPAGSGFSQVTLPADGMRLGLLGQASLLALNAHSTASSPTRRGKFIRETLLCQAIPPPPPDVVAVLPDTSEAQTTREKLSIHSEDPACKGCHSIMDPIGLGLENFDGIGAFRSEEGGLPIDASGVLDGVPFENPVELAAAIKEHPAMPTCVARSAYRYALGTLETSEEEVVIDELESRFAGAGFRFKSLLLAVVESPAFRYASGPQ